jgi:hypothetical protein
MGLAAAVVAAIEGIEVTSGGPAVRVVSVRPSPAPPDPPRWVIITVEAVHGGVVTRTVSALIAAGDVANHGYVVRRVTEAMGRESVARAEISLKAG